MNVAHAEFVVSNTRVDHCPKSKLPEYAFIGRSNVGKSLSDQYVVQPKAIGQKLPLAQAKPN